MRRPIPERFCCDEDLRCLGLDGLEADKDLEAWRDGRLRAETRELIDVLLREGVEGRTILDVGAGVGAIHLTLLEAGASRAIDVDASREYLAVASAEAGRRGLDDRVTHRYGDVVEMADSLPPVDIVSLDSVTCCYPYPDRLLGAVLRSKPELVGLTFPRNTWWMVAFMNLYNALNVLRRREDRYFIHPYERVTGHLAGAGYRQVHDGGSRPWRVVAFRR